MIHLKFLGHIKTSMGSEEMDVPRESISVETSSASSSRADRRSSTTGSPSTTL